jgi:hypothetical protein
VNTRTRAGLVVGGLATLVALAPSHISAQTSEPGTSTVTVTNTRSVPALVYLEGGLFDIRLGMVGAHSEEMLPLPVHLERGTVLKIFVHPEGSRDLATPDLTYAPGEDFRIYVPENDVGYVRPPPAEVIPNPGEGTTTITVKNSRSETVTLFVERGNFDVRLGTIPPNQEKTLIVPERLLEGHRSVELFVHPEHGLDLASEMFELEPGAHLLVKVPVE